MMALARLPHRHTAYVCALSFSLRGVPRTWRCGRTTAIALFAIVPMIATWYLGATAYLIFHDQLLAALISRQTDAQYAYEDRIAVLKTQLDRQTSRGMLDRQALTVTMHDLAERSTQLETRASTIDRLVGGLLDTPSRVRSALSVTPSASPSVSLQPEPGSDTPRSEPPRSEPPRTEDHVELIPEQQPTRIAGALDRIDAQQVQQVARLRDPTMRAVSRLRMALAQTGLPLSRFVTNDKGDVGGPFVPLSHDGANASFDDSVALLQDAAVQHARLLGIVDKVPIRRPIEGQLEVTSPFGARLDPFMGRPAMHTGLDLMDSYGGAVMATAGGIVTVAGPEGGYGNMVEIDHGNGLATRYAHLSSIDVVPHQRVSVGTVVGRVGSTGRATGPHLHYETRIDGEPVDPSRFLRAGMILARQ